MRNDARTATGKEAMPDSFASRTVRGNAADMMTRSVAHFVAEPARSVSRLLNGWRLAGSTIGRGLVAMKVFGSARDGWAFPPRNLARWSMAALIRRGYPMPDLPTRAEAAGHANAD